MKTKPYVIEHTGNKALIGTTKRRCPITRSLVAKIGRDEY